ncbi:MAG: hypothetical protein HQL06_02495 [Nitrospirae bacterium]|nr:hypothetical protein [Nitrospirota bacterium]
MEAQTLERDFDLTEIINGVEVMGPNPFGKHQNISSNIFSVLDRHVRKNKTGKVSYSPLAQRILDILNIKLPSLTIA